MEITAFHRDIGKFLASLDEVTSVKVTHLIELLGIRAYHLIMPFSKKLEKDLYELRAQSLQNVRIFYTFHQDRIVLLSAIYKKSQELSQKDLALARKRLKQLHSQ